MPNFEQRLVKTTLEGEKVYETPRPENNDELLNIRLAKDFAIAEAMKRGASAAEIMAIENAPDEEVSDIAKKAQDNVIQFPDKKAA